MAFPGWQFWALILCIWLWVRLPSHLWHCQLFVWLALSNLTVLDSSGIDFSGLPQTLCPFCHHNLTLCNWTEWNENSLLTHIHMHTHTHTHTYTHIGTYTHTHTRSSTQTHPLCVVYPPLSFCTIFCVNGTHPCVMYLGQSDTEPIPLLSSSFLSSPLPAWDFNNGSTKRHCQL